MALSETVVRSFSGVNGNADWDTLEVSIVAANLKYCE